MLLALKSHEPVYMRTFKNPEILRDCLFRKDGGGGGMVIDREKRCPLFRRSAGYQDAKDASYCQIDGSGTDCEGDVSFCDKPDAFREYFRRRLDEYKKRGEEKE